MLHGGHVLLHWARTQHLIALSSAESELHALATCASEGLGIRNMLIEMGRQFPLQLYTDSSAARGIIQRECAGRVKHLDIKTLWMQERETAGDLAIRKRPRAGNFSDLLSHHYSDPEAERHLAGMSCIRR